MVHVGHQRLQHLHLHVIQDEHRVTARVVLQNSLEVGTAGRQNNFMSLKQVIVTAMLDYSQGYAGVSYQDNLLTIINLSELFL